MEPRIGDADRDQAVSFLQEHTGNGSTHRSSTIGWTARSRLKRHRSSLSCSTTTEPRPPSATGTVPSATLAASGTTLIRDSALAAHPGRQPGDRTTVCIPQPQRGKADTVLAVMAAASWPAVILFCFATSWNYWWLIFIPIFISSIAGN